VVRTYGKQSAGGIVGYERLRRRPDLSPYTNGRLWWKNYPPRPCMVNDGKNAMKQRRHLVRGRWRTASKRPRPAGDAAAAARHAGVKPIRALAGPALFGCPRKYYCPREQFNTPRLANEVRNSPNWAWSI